MMCQWCGDETHSDYHLCSICDEDTQTDELAYE